MLYSDRFHYITSGRVSEKKREKKINIKTSIGAVFITLSDEDADGKVDEDCSIPNSGTCSCFE